MTTNPGGHTLTFGVDTQDNYLLITPFSNQEPAPPESTSPNPKSAPFPTLPVVPVAVASVAVVVVVGAGLLVYFKKRKR
jgi:hypothetical protein